MDLRGVFKPVMIFTTLFCGARCGYVSSTRLSVGTLDTGVLVIGQKDEFSFDGRFGGQGSDVGTFTKVQDRYYLSDMSAGRVLVFDQPPSSPDVAPILVLGKNSFQEIEDVPVSEISSVKMADVSSICGVGNKLYMVDTKAHRILGWNSIPTQNGQPADFVIGQSDFTSSATNGGAISPNSFSVPVSCATDGTRLYVSDQENDRVLVWFQAPSGNTPADIVLGQTSFLHGSSNPGGRSASTFDKPRGIMVHNSKLYIADRDNRRILVWNTPPTVSFAPADIVIGQASFTSANNIPSTTSFVGPSYMSVHGDKLYVSDLLGYRILVFNTIPTANTPVADFVLCQPDFVSSSNTYTSPLSPENYRACMPGELLSADGKLFIADRSRFRLIGFHSHPTSHFQTFDFVWGQPNTSANEFMGPPAAPNTVRPFSATVIDEKLVISDFANNRILIFNEAPQANFANADQVLFQPNAYSSAKLPTSAQTLFQPTSVKSDGTRVFLVDRGHHRVLIWNNKNDFFQGLGANIVLGQPDFTTSLPNQGLAAPTASTLYSPADITFDGSKLAVADEDNHRVLIWHNGVTNNQPADLVLGQLDFVTNTLNAGGRSARSLREPTALEMCQGKLLLSELTNHRILVWNQWPDAMTKAADLVVGQIDFTAAVTSDLMINLNRPRFPTCIENTLVIPDSANKRLAIWNSFPSVSALPLDRVFGRESTSSSGTIFTKDLSSTKLKEPLKALKWKNYWVLVDINRILIYKNKPF